MAVKRFTVDAKAVLTLGRNSIKDANTAIVELVKNAYDADAEVVELSIESDDKDGGCIRISDNGHGMSDEDVEKYWLRIGFSEKVENKTSQKFGRRKTGEKGIGRLSADRLGSALELKSKRTGKVSTGLKIDWSQFEIHGQEIGQVKLPVIPDPTPRVPKTMAGRLSKSGTELIITKLRQSWDEGDIEKVHSELELLLPPYPELAKTFSVKFSSDISPKYNGAIRYGTRINGEIEFSAKLQKNGTLEYRMSYFNPKDRTKRLKTTRKIPWLELAPDQGKGSVREKCKLGNIDLRLSYFVRRSDLLEGTGLKMSELRQYLDRNSGVKIYRDMVRVKPYGDPSGPEADWLGLGQRKISDPAGARRRTFKIAPSQLVGAVFAGRDASPQLEDSSSREGLIENDAFRQLKVVLMRCINIIESKYHELNKDRPRTANKAARAKAAVKSLSGNLSSLSEELAELQARVSGTPIDDDLESVKEQINLFIEQAQSAQKDIDDLADQNTVYRGLATVGIASAIFGHETATSISQAHANVKVVQMLLKQTHPDISKSQSRLEEAIEYMERVASWGKFALTRVNKDKRQKRRINVSTLVTSVLDELEGPMGSSDVDLKRAIAVGVQAKTFAMDVEAVLINFLTNAYYEVKRHQGIRTIRVRLLEKKAGQKSGFEISVSDNGGGIPPEHRETIWEPLFSLKTDDKGRATGTGLGLAIVKSAVEDLGGTVESKSKGPLGGAVFSAWFPGGLQ